MSVIGDMAPAAREAADRNVRPPDMAWMSDGQESAAAN